MVGCIRAEESKHLASKSRVASFGGPAATGPETQMPWENNILDYFRHHILLDASSYVSINVKDQKHAVLHIKETYLIKLKVFYPLPLG